MKSELEKMTYDEARAQLKEAEILFTNRQPLQTTVERIDDGDLVHFTELGMMGSALVIICSGLSALATGHIPLLVILGGCFGFSAFSMLLVALGYDGNPNKRIEKWASKFFLTKRQRSIQKKYNQSVKDFNDQTQIFNIFVQKKKKELEDKGVLSVLTNGNYEFYPCINNNGTISELTAQAWRNRQNNESENARIAEENLKYILDK